MVLMSHACGRLPRASADMPGPSVESADVFLRLYVAPATPTKWGTGTLTIVGVHGGPAFVTTSMAQLESLSTFGFDVAWFHQRGVPPSSAPVSGEYSLDALAGDVERVTHAVASHAPRVLVAFSWGALPAVAAVAASPSSFDGLVLVSPTPPTWTANAAVGPLIEENLDRMTMLGELPSDWRELPPCDRLLIWSSGLDEGPPRDRRSMARIEACELEVMRATRRAIGGYDLVETFRSLGVPVLVVRGEYDVLGRVAKFEDQPPPRTTARTLAGCGHGVLADADCRREFFAEFRRWALDIGPRPMPHEARDHPSPVHGGPRNPAQVGPP
jgi:pimeloyl-ACP methyl ester carboxylesterase